MERGKAMAKSEAKRRRGGRNRWRMVGWGTAALILLLPVAAMQFTAAADWTLFDFILAGVLIGSLGLILELTVRMNRNHAYRAGVASALAAAFLSIWANAAVGMIGSEANVFNLLFGGVIFVGLAGALAARFRAGGMALSMLVAGLLQIAVSVIGLASDPRGGLFSAAFAALWLLSALLFRNSAHEQSAPAGGAKG